MTGTDLLYPVAVLLLAYTIMGITGFGSALVAVPLLTWFWPLPEVVALMIVLDVPASAIHGGLNFKMVQWRALRQMLPGMAAGTCVGWWLLGQLDKQWPLFFLGVYITLVGLRSLRKASGQEGGSSPMAFHGMSALVGVIEVMFATAGPVVIAVLQKKIADIHAIRATVPVGMVFAGSIAIAVLFATQSVAWADIGPRWLWAFPVAAVGVWLGNRLARRIPVSTLRVVMAVLLSVSGIALTRHLWA